MGSLATIKVLMDKHTPSTVTWIRAELLRISKLPGFHLTIKVLDIGSSTGIIWRRVASGGWLYRNGIELKICLFDASPETSGKQSSDDNLMFEFRKGIAPSDLGSFSSEEFDLITAFDIIEHLTKDQGYHLLYEINRLAPTSIIRCPNGFVWQPPFESNPYQAHISGWSPRELRAIGWRRQFGECGLKVLVGIGAVPKWKLSSNKVRWLISFPERIILAASQLWLYRFPGLCAEIVAIKRERAFDLERYITEQDSSSHTSTTY